MVLSKFSMTSPFLLPTCLAIPVYVAEEIAVGRSVFQNFVHEEFEDEGVPEEILEEVPADIQGENVSDHGAAAGASFAHAPEPVCIESPMVLRTAQIVGANIRELAKEFAKSKERKTIKEEADKLDLNTITDEGFFIMLEEVFRHGITKYNVIALFCYCSDVLKKCVRMKLKDIGIQLFKWAVQYIVDRVCAWVAKHGGWENVIKNTLSGRQIVVIGAAAVGICAVGGFILYKWST